MLTELVALLTIPDLKRAGIILFLVLGNWLAASLVALANGTYDFKKAPLFFSQTFLPFVGGFLLFQAGLHILSPSSLYAAFGNALSPEAANNFDAAALWITFGTIIMSTTKSFVTNLSTLLGVTVNGAQKLAATNTSANTPKA